MTGRGVLPCSKLSYVPHSVLIVHQTRQVGGSQPGAILSRGDLWQCLETFLIITAWAGGAPGIWQVEARGAARHPTGHTGTKSAEAEDPGGAALLVVIRAWNLLAFYMVSKYRILGM